MRIKESDTSGVFCKTVTLIHQDLEIKLVCVWCSVRFSVQLWHYAPSFTSLIQFQNNIRFHSESGWMDFVKGFHPFPIPFFITTWIIMKVIIYSILCTNLTTILFCWQSDADGSFPVRQPELKLIRVQWTERSRQHDDKLNQRVHETKKLLS